MFEKEIEKMLSQMSPKQKSKVANIMQDEEKMKKMIAGIDPEQLKKVADSLGMKNISKDDLFKEIEKKF